MAATNRKSRTGPKPAYATAEDPHSVFYRIDPTTAQPCLVCLRLAMDLRIQPRSVMPLPPFPGRSWRGNRPYCRDCQSGEALTRLGGHPDFVASRLTVSNERIESLVLPAPLAKSFGMCGKGIVRYAALGDLDAHLDWLDKFGIPTHTEAEEFIPRLPKPVPILDEYPR